MTDTSLLTLANTCAQAAIGTLQRKRGELPNPVTHKLFDDISALIVAAYTPAQPDVRRLGFVTRAEGYNDRLIIADLDIALIARKAAEAKRAEVSEVTLTLGDGWYARCVEYFVRIDGDDLACAPPAGVFISEDDRERVWGEHYQPEPDEDAPYGSPEALALYLQGFEAKRRDREDWNEGDVAACRLYINPEGGVSLEITTFADHDDKVDTLGFSAEELTQAPKAEGPLPT